MCKLSFCWLVTRFLQHFSSLSCFEMSPPNLLPFAFFVVRFHHRCSKRTHAVWCSKDSQHFHFTPFYNLLNIKVYTCSILRPAVLKNEVCIILKNHNLKSIMTFVFLNIGVHIRWKKSEVSAQLDRGAGMCTSGWRLCILAPNFICGYTFKVACVKGWERGGGWRWRNLPHGEEAYTRVRGLAYSMHTSWSLKDVNQSQKQ